LGEIYVPKQELGNEGKAGCAALTGYELLMKRPVGRASSPARRFAQAGKPVPPEELFGTGNWTSRPSFSGLEELTSL
jgi:hypothetical protein